MSHELMIGIKPEEGQYPATNEIKGWEALESAAPAPADLCKRCSGMAFIASVGNCVECAGITTSGSHKLCRKCSRKLQQCEHCLAALGGAPVIRDANSGARDANTAASRPAGAAGDGGAPLS